MWTKLTAILQESCRNLDKFKVSPVNVVVEKFVVELKHAKLGELIDHDPDLEWAVYGYLALAHLDLVRVRQDDVCRPHLHPVCTRFSFAAPPLR